jgi:hypothetical protein
MIFVKIKERFQNRIMEWYVAAQLLIWGIVLLSPINVFAAAPIFFKGFAAIGEDGLGFIMTGLGLIRIVALIINGAVPNVTPLIRLAGAFIGCGVWFLISSEYWLNAPLGIWVAAWPMAFLSEFITMYRAAQDMRIGLKKAALNKLTRQVEHGQ